MQENKEENNPKHRLAVPSPQQSIAEQMHQGQDIPVSRCTDLDGFFQRNPREIKLLRQNRHVLTCQRMQIIRGGEG